MARVLVVDDDRQTCTMIRRMLERVGHEVDVAESGAAGVRAFMARPADVAVVDIFMPEQSGWQTIRALQRLSPGLPIIVMSGGGALEPLEPGYPGTLNSLRGQAEYRVMLKPFEWQELTTNVAEVLQGRAATVGEG